jgi:hypothetical protein
MAASIALAKMAEFKHSMQGISAGLPRKKFQELKTHWTVAGHPKQERLDEFRAIPSLWK